MTAILRMESRKRLRGSLILVGVFGLLSALYFSIFPSFGDDAEALAEAFPEPFFEFFGIDQIHTIEGFIAAEVYSFFWVILLGVYFAYICAGSIIRDIDSRKMDLTLSYPVSREGVIVQKMASLWVPLVILNTTVPLIVFVGARIIGESIDPVALAMVHVLSIPYLLVCAAIGFVLSVSVTRVRSAQGAAIGGIVLLWLVDGFSRMDPDLDWIGYATPSRYFDETAILVHEEFAFGDAAILLVAALIVFSIATIRFVYRDI